MRLKPLEQWLCDTCGDVIEKPEDGWVYWTVDDTQLDGGKRKTFGFHIVHQWTASPRAHHEHRCYPPEIQQDLPLSTMIGPRGIVEFISHMDIGAFHDPKGEELSSVIDVRNWAETFRRLHVPYYEEARLHFKQAREDGTLEGTNEIALYTESVLKSLVEQYGDEGEST